MLWRHQPPRPDLERRKRAPRQKTCAADFEVSQTSEPVGDREIRGGDEPPMMFTLTSPVISHPGFAWRVDVASDSIEIEILDVDGASSEAQRSGHSTASLARHR